MKGWQVLAGALLASAFAVPAMAHHGAEGIVSDDIWLRIDEQLCDPESPSPHCVVFENAMGTMTLEVAERGTHVILTSYLTVPADEVYAIVAQMYVALDELNRVNTRNPDAASVPTITVFPVEPEDPADPITEFVIVLEERVGSGESQDDLVTTPGRGG